MIRRQAPIRYCRRQRQAATSIALAFSLAGCQVVTGLDKLEADRTGNTQSASTAGDNLGNKRTGAGGAQAGAGSAQSINSRATAGAGGSKASTITNMAAGSGAQAVDDDAGVTSSDGDCVTRITYGNAWIRPADHVDRWDEVSGVVTWDGSCEVDGSGNSFARLSNGWQPYFTGRNGCVVALDVRGSCGQQAACSTRISYGSSWFHPDGHIEAFDEVAGVVTTDALCKADGEESYVVLSNGWQPHFMGQNSCEFSIRYSQCNGLFSNPVVNSDCPDPGLIWDADRWVMACTAEDPQFSLRSSRDLVHWKMEGSVFTDATKPQWADRDFWSPDLHRVGDRYLAYFNARQTDGESAIGVATSSNVLGPYRDKGEPLLSDSPGAIDPQLFEAPDGTLYLVWKHEGNTRGGVASIKIQPLTGDGLS